tara:strand:+ start:456 stop:956 length:501 start_codon:yes stop_codon:yes gene_type:complete
MKNEIKILDKSQISQKILRLSWEIYENNFNEGDIYLVGIGDKGLLIANIVNENLRNISNLKPNVSKITFNRDQPHDAITLSISTDAYKNKNVILVDDVLYSGRTLMYCSKAFLSIPLKKMSVLVLVDRNHNTYPIKANYVGLSLSTTLKEYIKVDLSDSDQGVYLS